MSFASSSKDLPPSLGTEILAEARAAWPAVTVPPDLFRAYVAERLPAEVDLGSGLRRLRIPDLYLACACVHGDEKAIAAFELDCMAVLDRALRRLGLDRDAVAEVKQRLRHRLLVSEIGVPRLAEFAGHGDLRTWVRVIAVHEALNMVKQARRHTPLDEDFMMERLSPRDSPELDYLKHLYRREFKEAFAWAAERLSNRERTLLRQQYIDCLSVIQISKLYRVHRATASRWLDCARHALLSATRARLVERLNVGAADLDAIMQLIASHLEASVTRVFRR